MRDATTVQCAGEGTTRTQTTDRDVQKVCNNGVVQNTGQSTINERTYDGACRSDTAAALKQATNLPTDKGGELQAGAVNALVDRYSLCRWLDNNGTDNFFVPTGSLSDWQAFITNRPSGVVAANCCPASTVTLTASDGQTFTFNLDTGREGSTTQLGQRTLSHEFTLTRPSDGATWIENVSDTFICTSGAWTSQGIARIGDEPPVSATHGWVVGAYGVCSATCGGGTQSRSVLCVDTDGNVVADSNCTTTKPATSQSCNTQACVSTDCGTGFAKDQNGVCRAVSAITTAGGNSGSFWGFNGATGTVVDHEGTARRNCAMVGAAVMHDFAGDAYGRKKPGKSCGKSDTDHYRWAFYGDVNSVDSLLNLANYTVVWSARKDTNCLGYMRQVLCSGPNYLVPQVNTIVVNTTDASAATPPAGMSACPAGLDLSSPDPYSANPNFFAKANQNVTPTGSHQIISASSLDGRYTPVLAKQELNCYQQKVVSQPVYDYNAPANQWTTQQVCMDLDWFGTFCYDVATPPVVGNTNYYSLYTINTPLYCKQTQVNNERTGNRVSNCNGTGRDGDEYRSYTASVGNVCGNDQNIVTSCVADPDPSTPDPTEIDWCAMDPYSPLCTGNWGGWIGGGGGGFFYMALF